MTRNNLPGHRAARRNARKEWEKKGTPQEQTAKIWLAIVCLGIMGALALVFSSIEK